MKGILAILLFWALGAAILYTLHLWARGEL